MDDPKGSFAGITLPKPFGLERQLLLDVKMQCVLLLLLWYCKTSVPSGLVMVWNSVHFKKQFFSFKNQDLKLSSIFPSE